MITNLTKQDLIDFEENIAAEFNGGNIRAPVHLEQGNEEYLLKVFENIEENDWVFCSWRSQLKCLLKGVPADELKAKIMKGYSISLCFEKYRVFSSAIVAGQIPIALGVAMGIRENGGEEKVWCFVGDMSCETGAFHEAIKYAYFHELPIEFVVEDNGKSVCTDTKEVWGFDNRLGNDVMSLITYYQYESKWPHAGAGSRVQF